MTWHPRVAAVNIFEPGERRRAVSIRTVLWDGHGPILVPVHSGSRAVSQRTIALHQKLLIYNTCMTYSCSFGQWQSQRINPANQRSTIQADMTHKKTMSEGGVSENVWHIILSQLGERSNTGHNFTLL